MGLPTSPGLRSPGWKLPQRSAFLIASLDPSCSVGEDCSRSCCCFSFSWLVAVVIVFPAPDELLRMPDGFELVTRLRYAVGLGLSLALSITITRRISIFILQLPAKRSMSAAAFSLLLLVHLLLLVVWYPIYVAAVTFLEIFFDTAQRVIFNRHPFPDHITIILDDRPRVATTANDFLWLFWKQEFHSWLGFIEDVLQGKSPSSNSFFAVDGRVCGFRRDNRGLASDRNLHGDVG